MQSVIKKHDIASVAYFISCAHNNIKYKINKINLIKTINL
jgi:hypothetical protein